MSQFQYPPVDAVEVHRAVEILRAGGLVAIPTETVYGLAADADNEKAVMATFAVKGRPTNHPLIVHVARPTPCPLGRASCRPKRDFSPKSSGRGP